MSAEPDGAILPSWRYWAGVAVVFPVAGVFPAVWAVDVGGARGAVALVVIFGLAATALARERQLRTMGPGWRAVWVVLGLLLGTCVALVGFGVLLLLAAATEST